MHYTSVCQEIHSIYSTSVYVPVLVHVPDYWSQWSVDCGCLCIYGNFESGKNVHNMHMMCKNI